MNQEKIEQIHILWDELADFEAAESDAALGHLMAALCKLVDAQNISWIGSVRLDGALPGDPVHGWRVRHVRFLHPFALADNAVREQIKGLEQGDNIDLTTVRNVAMAGTFRANRLCDLAPAEWFDSGYYHRYYRGIGKNDAIYVAFPVNQDAESYFGIWCGPNREPFSVEERDTAAYALRGIKWFHRRIMLSHGLLIASSPLSPSERKVMHFLLTDMAEKEIARQLGLAVSTTHQYITGVFRKFNVSSRAALTSLWLNRPT